MRHPRAGQDAAGYQVRKGLLLIAPPRRWCTRLGVHESRRVARHHSDGMAGIAGGVGLVAQDGYQRGRAVRSADEDGRLTTGLPVGGATGGGHGYKNKNDEGGM